MDEVNYYAIIPAKVRYADIPPMAKLLYGEITALSNKKGFCWATNSYFANLYKMADKSISRLIETLTKNGFIICQYDNTQENKTRRKIHINESIDKNVYTQKCGGGIDKNVEAGIDKNVEHNNTSMNNTSMNNNNMLAVANNTSLVKFDNFLDFFNNTCPSLPKVQIMSDKRKKALNSIIKQYGKEKLVYVLQEVEKSDFLSGRNGKWGACNIDWVLKPSNFIKILEGNYSNSRNKETQDQIIDREYKKARIQEMKPKSEKIVESFNKTREYLSKFKAKNSKELIDVNN